LQEQVDLLKYHNERLTRRIEAVQEKENVCVLLELECTDFYTTDITFILKKGSSFSLLGGAMKKELEKSAQALDAATIDLQNKIQENEELHKEMAEINHIYTSHVNGLHQQIADLEKQVEQDKQNVSNEQSDTRQRVQVIRQEKTALEAELRKAKEELAT
jgi:predicted  nucleic acid-binding Zn-ribbon protein